MKTVRKTKVRLHRKKMKKQKNKGKRIAYKKNEKAKKQY
jgi:hypothetical protein